MSRFSGHPADLVEKLGDEVLEEMKAQLTIQISKDILLVDGDFKRAMSFTRDMASTFESLGLSQDMIAKLLYKRIDELAAFDGRRLRQVVDEGHEREANFGHQLRDVIPLGWHILSYDVTRFCLMYRGASIFVEAVILVCRTLCCLLSLTTYRLLNVNDHMLLLPSCKFY